MLVSLRVILCFAVSRALEILYVPGEHCRRQIEVDDVLLLPVGSTSGGPANCAMRLRSRRGDAELLATVVGVQIDSCAARLRVLGDDELVDFSCTGQQSSAEVASFNIRLEITGSIEFAIRVRTTERRAASDLGTFWQITDTHWDPTYSSGGTALSCPGIEPQERFGNFACDAPYELLESAVGLIKSSQENADFVAWTGDDTPHIWDDQLLNSSAVLEIIANTSTLLQLQLGQLQVFSAIGNHDWSPKSQLPAEKHPLYEEISEIWSPWLNETQKATFSEGGFYSGWTDYQLEVLVLNTNLYYQSNKETEGLPDPANQLAWTEVKLRKAEEEGRKVLVMSHMPPGVFEKHRSWHWFYPELNERFVELLVRYSSVISGFVSAHHHTDAFRIVRKQDKAVGTIFLAPAVSPWETTLDGVIGGTGNNPSVRLYHYNRTSGAILDIEQFWLNLTQANSVGTAHWQREYIFSEQYDVSDMLPTTLSDLAERFVYDDALFRRYIVANGVLYDPNEQCDGICRSVHICAMRFLRYDRYETCVQEFTSGCSFPFLASSALSFALAVLVGSALRLR